MSRELQRHNDRYSIPTKSLSSVVIHYDTKEEFEQLKKECELIPDFVNWYDRGNFN